MGVMHQALHVAAAARVDRLLERVGDDIGGQGDRDSVP